MDKETWMTADKASFYSTYEELKQNNNQVYKTNKEAFLQYLWGIETIYFHTLKFFILNRFYSTYEELKRKTTGEKIQYVLIVFTVPMRNWNFATIIFIFSTSNVFTVPMRNWNSLWCWKDPRRLRVFTVPMRNWNFRMKKFSMFCMKRFYSTYEELKRRLQAAISPDCILFLQYLWGIETPENQ